MSYCNSAGRWDRWGVRYWCGALALSLSLAATAIAETPQVQIAPKPVALIPPGTVIEDEVPEGWTHVISQTHSRIGTGDVDKINSTIAHLASFLSSNLLARVEQRKVDGQPRYRLDEVAVGLGTKVNNQETIISSDTLSRQKVRLGILEKIGLRRAEAKLPELLMIGRSDTIAVFDGVSQILRDDQHVEVMARHVVLVDENSGELITFVWFIDLEEDGSYGQVFGPIDVLPAGARIELTLNVDEDLFVLGLITEQALAVAKRPDGLLQIEVPTWFREPASQAKLDAQTMEQFQSSLPRLLRTARREAPSPPR
jgi:hypothetical protein